MLKRVVESGEKVAVARRFYIRNEILKIDQRDLRSNSKIVSKGKSNILTILDGLDEIKK